MRNAHFSGEADAATLGALDGEADAQLLYKAASMYYAQGETMAVIARHLGVSRSTVSRLLARARTQGIVRIELVEPGGAGSMERALQDEFEVNVSLVPVREGTTEIHRLQQVAAVGGVRMLQLIGRAGAGMAKPESQLQPGAAPEPLAAPLPAVEVAGAHSPAPSAAGTPPAREEHRGVVVGVAWGTTMNEVAASLPLRSVPGLTLVQLNGACDPWFSGPNAAEALPRMGQMLGARVVSFPVPAFFDQVATRQAMWLERSVKRVLALAHSCQLAVFGVGALRAQVPSQVYSGGHLTRADLALLRKEGVVGDVCTVLLRADGTWADVALNARATGPTPQQLARIPRRLCIAAGVSKAQAVLAALRARVATDLVIDDATARVVMELNQR